MPFAQLVMGPAGCGKSTFCNAITQHNIPARKCKIVNLDPAVEYLAYKPEIDIRDLISVDDVMEDEDVNLGPKGSLIYCMDYLLQNTDWLKEAMADLNEDDYYIFDCPGQVELYGHRNLMDKFIGVLESWDFMVCCVYMLDVQFITNYDSFLSGSLSALSSSLNLGSLHVNVLSKVDLLDSEGDEKLRLFCDTDFNCSNFNDKYKKLNESFSQSISQYGAVKFQPLNLNDDDSIADVLHIIDSTMQYGNIAEDEVVNLFPDF